MKNMLVFLQIKTLCMLGRMEVSFTGDKKVNYKPQEAHETHKFRDTQQITRLTQPHLRIIETAHHCYGETNCQRVTYIMGSTIMMLIA